VELDSSASRSNYLVCILSHYAHWWRTGSMRPS
jgi:hypothetical protein